MCRKTTREFAEGRTKPVRVNVSQVHAYLGAPRHTLRGACRPHERARRGRGAGVDPDGRGSSVRRGDAHGRRQAALTITGQLGEVMKESAQAALSYVRSHADELHIPQDFYPKSDVHIHVPAGAIPKDGPSAGVTMITALASLLTGKKVKPRLAMTGEITLQG